MEECEGFVDRSVWTVHCIAASVGTPPRHPIPSATISKLFSIEVSDPENTSSFHLLHTSLRILALLIEFHRCDVRVLEEWSELLFTSRVARVGPVAELVQIIWERSFDSVCE